MLINLTNHPSARWSEEQKAAAGVYGEIVDMPFPQIDEAGDENYIATLADEYLQKILLIAERENVIVHLMGELTFCFALLCRLKKHCITCVASTTKRIVCEEEPGKKIVTFQFVKFREY